MPTYRYQCRACSTVWDEIRPLRLHSNTTQCTCSGIADQVLTRPMLSPDLSEPYQSPATGKWITSRREHVEDLARSGCRVYEPGETQDFIKRKAEERKAQLAEYDTLIDSMPDAAFEPLVQAIQSE